MVKGGNAPAPGNFFLSYELKEESKSQKSNFELDQNQGPQELSWKFTESQDV